MGKVMNKTGQHQQTTILTSKPRARCKQTCRHDDMRKMAGMVIDVAAGIVRGGRQQMSQGRCRHRPPVPATGLQARPAADGFKIPARTGRPEIDSLHGIGTAWPGSSEILRTDWKVTETMARAG